MSRQHHTITNAIVLTLALTASAAPVALADPPPLVRSQTQTTRIGNRPDVGSVLR
jgi:hypothetical protein